MSEPDDRLTAPAARRAAPRLPRPKPPLSTERLFAPGETEIRIEHAGSEYRLRITKSNKLLLYR